MDAADVFRQGLGSVIPRPAQYFYNPPGPPRTSQPPQSAPPLRRPPTQQRDDESDVNSHRIAHTLTACCRCRQAGALLSLSSRIHPRHCPQLLLRARGSWRRETAGLKTDLGAPSPSARTWVISRVMMRLTASSRYSVKQGATQRSLDVYPAKDPAQFANTSIPRGTRRSTATMSSTFNRKYASWRRSLPSTLTTTMTTPRAQKISCDQAALSNSASQMRRRAT